MTFNRKTLIGFTVASVTLAITLSASGDDDSKRASVGQPAPQFSLKGVDGKEHKLADLRGKVVVLEWSNHQCPVCNRHVRARTAENVLNKFEGKPVVWLAIDSTKTCDQNAEKIKDWAAKATIGYPILLDAPGIVGKKYGAKTTPHMFVIDQKGILAYVGAMDDDPTGTSEVKRNYVEEAIRSLLVGSSVATTRTTPYGCSVKYRS